ncbi:demethylmenaquinone methyltransferase / 2-methoxy-6-polyprenyl-1,4-benzoquinol methylase [Dehalogenimonas formicexedens]|uniref:Demethylmenaquinone methyltransferase / 2-methoxy-6-polyprenyl-1,4-benzoquinol methylase n=1 Tax=Dehalogenimonas formicexedens TaxID=1839801 RepID=A0A1P8F4T3_9CHLR|nr:demethylmenaquinone methyltransferase / 2-methoxy-6-polyprenyl-1,4-benzoquinol methylase [Dehalogenimonas formicexedens]
MPETISAHEDYNKKFFAGVAPFYDLLRFVFPPLRRKAASFLCAPRGSKIIDVATGTGDQAAEFARRRYSVTGVDLSGAMLERARHRIKPGLKLEFTQANAACLPFGDNSFDGSSISLALHDMPREIEVQVLKEMRRVTRGRGEILIVEYADLSKGIKSVLNSLIRLYESKYYRDFARRDLGKLLADAGLTIRRQKNIMGIFRAVVAG